MFNIRLQCHVTFSLFNFACVCVFERTVSAAHDFQSCHQREHDSHTHVNPSHDRKTGRTVRAMPNPHYKTHYGPDTMCCKHKTVHQSTSENRLFSLFWV